MSDRDFRAEARWAREIAKDWIDPDFAAEAFEEAANRIESLKAELKLWENQPDHHCGGDCHHDSDCAMHNNPAYPRQPCDCSLQEKR